MLSVNIRIICKSMTLRKEEIIKREVAVAYVEAIMKLTSFPILRYIYLGSLVMVKMSRHIFSHLIAAKITIQLTSL